jgi:hypothetical protein
MEIRVGDADKLLTVEEVKAELNLRFERLKMKTSSNEKENFWNKKFNSVGNLKQIWPQVIPVQEPFKPQW